MANAIVLEVLEFVRPIRLQVEHMSLVDVIKDAIALADTHAPRGEVDVDGRAARRSRRRFRATRTSCGSCSRTC